jgi:hypothetical protein
MSFGSSGPSPTEVVAFRDAGVQRIFLWPVADEIVADPAVQ